jgi:hypothetical protein
VDAIFDALDMAETSLISAAAEPVRPGRCVIRARSAAAATKTATVLGLKPIKPLPGKTPPPLLYIF